MFKNIYGAYYNVYGKREREKESFSLKTKEKELKVQILLYIKEKLIHPSISECAESATTARCGIESKT